MYLWKVDSLVEDFKSGKVTQKEEFKYMLLFTIFMVLVSDPVLYISSSYTHYDTLSSVLLLGISIFGVYYCYKVNSIGDDKDFIVRVMCIGLPVMVRLLVVLISVFFICGILEAFFLYPELLDEETVQTTPLQFAIVSGFVAVYYWYLSIKIRAVSSKNA